MRLQSTDPPHRRQLSDQLIDEAAAALQLAARFVPPAERPAWEERTRRELARVLHGSAPPRLIESQARWLLTLEGRKDGEQPDAGPETRPGGRDA